MDELDRRVVKHEYFKIWFFILYADARPPFRIVHDWLEARVEFSFVLLFLVHLLDSLVFYCRRARLDLHFTDRALSLLALVRTDEHANAIELIIVSVVIWHLGWLANQTTKVVDRHPISIEPVLALEFVACNPEVNARHPSVSDRIWN